MKKNKIKSLPSSQQRISSYFSKPSVSKLQLKKSNSLENIAKPNKLLEDELGKEYKNNSQDSNVMQNIPELLSKESLIEKSIDNINDNDLDCKSMLSDYDNLNLSNNQIAKKTFLNISDDGYKDSPTKKIKLSPKKSKEDCEGTARSNKENMFVSLEPSIITSMATEGKQDSGFVQDSDDLFISTAFDDDFFSNDMDYKNLQLDKWQKCQVISIEKGLYYVLIVESATTHEKGTCILKDFWKQIIMDVGVTISLIAVRTDENKFCISNEGGFLILWPDNLITGTEIVGSLFCMRKSILQSNYRGIDSGNKNMVIGSLVHELLQSCLNNKLYSIHNITIKCETMLKKQNILSTLYDSGMNAQEAVLEIKKYIPHISDFMEKYVDHTKHLGNTKSNYTSNTSKKSWNGVINRVIDIEENIWSPKMGISGRIDATVEVTIHKKSKKLIMPLELKTGKHQNSAEHRGQVILYTMIMSLLEENSKTEGINEGLLLYLKDSAEVKEVVANYTEKRDLIILRNQLAYFIEKLQESFRVAEKQENLDVILPDPINHHSACKSCPYLTLCSIFLSQSKRVELPENHLLVKLKESAIGHLNKNDIDYFIKWCFLIKLEELDRSDNIQRKDIWNVEPTEREKLGKCLANMSLISIQGEDDKFEHVFKKNSSDPNESILHSQFQSGNYVVVGTNSKYAENSGFISEIDEKFINIILNKDLSKRNCKSMMYNIDAYDSSSMIISNLTNLGLLMDNSDQSSFLRKIMINKQYTPDTGKLPRSVSNMGQEILKKLNKSQIRAVLRAVLTEEFLLIKGMPGTGKTQTLVALIELFVKLGKTILITSHTHSAIDNVFLRLKKCNLKMMRLGASNRIHSGIQEYAESFLTQQCDSLDALEKLYNSVEVVGVTCLGSNHSLLTKRTFDVCIVDESTQVPQCSIIRPLLAAKKFILLGDPNQLPPIVKSNKARSLGMDESLFNRLDNLGATITLPLQYRMNKTIMTLANKLTYQDQLVCGNEKVENGVLLLDGKVTNDSEWLRLCTSTSLEHSVVMIDTGYTFDQNQDEHFFRVEEDFKELKYSNLSECALILHIISSLSKVGVKSDQIGIITPYRHQVLLIKTLVNKFAKINKTDFNQLEINTVDQYQGKDKDIILYSCAKSWKYNNSASMENHLLEDKRRLTVAITRAKYKLIVIGDVDSLKCYRPFRELFECSSKNNIGSFISLLSMFNSGKFSWKEIVKILS